MTKSVEPDPHARELQFLCSGHCRFAYSALASYPVAVIEILKAGKLLRAHEALFGAGTFSANYNG